MVILRDFPLILHEVWVGNMIPVIPVFLMAMRHQENFLDLVMKPGFFQPVHVTIESSKNCISSLRSYV